jgi:amino acid adenylation domain-containing protein
VTRSYAFPASFAQERLWFLSRLDPGLPVHNLNLRIDLPGEIDPGRLRQALAVVVGRHEALRTALAVEDGALAQLVAVELPVAVACTDLTAEGGRADGRADEDAGGRADGERELPPQERRERAFTELAAREAALPFDPGSAPLWRAHLVRVAERDWRLVFVVHHAVFDARSGLNLVNELMEAYDAIGSGRPPHLPDLPVQYADYAVWQRERLAAGAIEDQFGYWRERLAGLPEDAGLPLDRPRPAGGARAGAEYHAELPAGLAADLERLAKERGATLFMVLLAAFKAVLARFTGRTDVVVGSPVAGRDLPEVEPLIGMFVNTLVLRTGLGGDPSFAELLERVRTTVVDALDHAEVPFDRLVEVLRPRRDPSRPPLHQVGFNLLPMEGRHQFSNGTAQLDLTLDVVRTGDGIGVWAEYGTELLEEATVARLVEAYRVLLEAVAADPGTRLSELPLMTGEQRHRLLVEANATDAPYPALPLHELIAGQARRTPGATAVRTGDGTELTYAELDERSAALARVLRARGVDGECCVAVCLPRDATLVTALVAVLRAGAYYLPLDPAYPPERLKHLLHDSGARLLLTHPDLLERLPAGHPPEILLDGLTATPSPQDGDPADPLPEVGPDRLAYLIYTSGSTGRPKGVEVPHRGLVSLVTHVAREQGEGDVLLLTSLSFDIAALEIFTPLLTGRTLVVAPDEAVRTPKEVRRAAEKADLVQLTPSAAEMLLGELPPGLPRIICGGEPLPPDLADRLLDVTPRLWNFYGPTETTVWSTRCRVVGGGRVGIGVPVANTRVYVVDGGLRPVPVGVAGELLIGGVGVARGYHGRAGLTAERFVPDPFGGGGGRLYRTGDLVRWGSSGLEFLGRLDDQVKVRGVRVEPGEVAGVLREHPLVRRAVVVVRGDAPGGRGLVAYVDWAGGGSGGEEDGGAGVAARLRDHLRPRVQDAMIPAAFVVVDDFPTLPSGKLDRAALPPPAGGDTPSYTPPRTPMEETLAAVWGELLGRERVGATDDFFALGGHSLLVVRLIGRIAEEFGVELPLRSCFDATTVEQQALAVLEAGLTDEELLELLAEEER